MSTFALPTIHTWFDLLRSTVDPAALLELAARRHLRAVGVVDGATTLAHVRLARAGAAQHVHVAYGTTLHLRDGSILRVLARTDDGYRSMCALIAAQHRHPDGLPSDLLRAHMPGLYLLCGGRGGRLWQTVAAGDHPRALTLLGKLQTLAERDDRFAVECQQYADDADTDRETLRCLLDLAQQAGARCIATHDVHVLQPADTATHRLVRSIAAQRSFYADDPELGPWRSGQGSRYTLPDAATWFRTWDGLEHLPAGSAAVLLDCQIDLLGPRRFPGASLPAATIYDQLWQRAFDGLKTRYARITPELITQLHHEITEITQQEVGAFLLQAADLVAHAAERGIRMILQGSGTGSLTCFALGISPVDPLHAGGIFERFAGVHRGVGDVPDLDFGVPAGREHEIVTLLHTMHGADHVAYLTAVSKLANRSAIRAAAQAFGWTNDQIRLLHRKLKRDDALDRTERMIANAAAALDGQPAHLLRHPSGLIVTDGPIATVFGLGACADGPMLLADKDDAEALQVLKIDILSWYGLAILEHVEAALAATVYPRPDLWNIPRDDRRTGDMLANADTRSIPYLQSPAMMTLLRALRVRTEDDLALALGALRPGASTTRPRLIAAMQGGEASIPGWDVFSAQHQAALAAVLAPSRGAFIFDEDLLRVLHLLGFSYADAERLRKTLKKGDDRATRAEHQIRAAALTSGWSDAEIDVLIDHLRFIQRYCFLRGHALALAYMTYRVAHAAAHHPAPFCAAVLDTLGDDGGGMYPSLVYLVEARRHGVTVVPPTINSGWLSTAQGSTVRCGLRVLRAAVSPDTLQRIAVEGTQSRFTGVADLCRRVALTAHELDTLICVGALDALVNDRRQARRDGQAARRQPRNQPALLDEPRRVQPQAAMASESLEERAREEYAALGLCWSVDHPLDLYRMPADADSMSSARLPQLVGREVLMAGIIVAARRIRTATGDPMVFLSVCDRVGVVEVTVFAEVAATLDAAVRSGVAVTIRGLVTQDVERGLGLEARTIKPLRNQEEHQMIASNHIDWTSFSDD